MLWKDISFLTKKHFDEQADLHGHNGLPGIDEAHHNHLDGDSHDIDNAHHLTEEEFLALGPHDN